MPSPVAVLTLDSASVGLVSLPTHSIPRPGRERLDWTMQSDDVVVRGCVAADDDAYAELVRRFQRSLFNVAYRLLGRYDDATDATQQALVQAYLALPSSRLGLPVRPWLFRILRNQCIDRLRRKDAIPFSSLRAADGAADCHPPVDATDKSPLPEDLAERSDLERILLEAIDGLAPRYRTVVLLRYLGDLSFAEIGSRLNVPEPIARTLFQRAKAMLRITLAGRL
jgi:RNA polymerase sigma factor (sigma-70 family)